MKHHQPIARSISLTYDQVCDLVEEWLNTNLLRTHHHVIDIDLIDGQQFNISLEAPYGPVVEENAGLISAVVIAPVPPAATNGHAAPTVTRRPITSDELAFIKTHLDWTAARLGEQLGFPATTIAGYLTRFRKEAKHAAPSATPFPAAGDPAGDPARAAELVDHYGEPLRETTD